MDKRLKNMAKIKNEQLADLVSIIQSEHPNYTAQQIFEKLDRKYSIKEIAEIVVELYCEENHFSEPEKIKQIKNALLGEK